MFCFVLCVFGQTFITPGTPATSVSFCAITSVSNYIQNKGSNPLDQIRLLTDTDTDTAVGWFWCWVFGGVCHRNPRHWP